MRQKDHPEEVELFYAQLRDTHAKYRKKNSIVIMAGDFNAKLGLRQHTSELYMAAHGKGTRNESGEKLASFLSHAELYATNTTFQKSMRHRSTWNAYIQGKQIYNQIDYICINRNIIDKLSHLLTNAQSHDGMIFRSDHKMVVTNLDLSAMYKLKRAMNLQNVAGAKAMNFDTTTTLVKDEETRTQYQEHHKAIITTNTQNAQKP